jgi:S1-C subfamily serine protease
MRSLSLLVLAVALSGCGIFKFSAPKTAAPEAPKVDVLARAVQNVIALTDGDGNKFCTGVLAEGLALTAEHCVNGPAAFYIQTVDGKSYRAVVAKQVPEYDLAVLTVIGLRLRDTVPLSPEGPSLGQKIISIGYPLGADLHLMVGYVGNPLVDEGKYFTIDGQLIPGNSGGPIFNEFGELLGIVSATMAFPDEPYPNLLPVGYVVHWFHVKNVIES